MNRRWKGLASAMGIFILSCVISGCVLIMCTASPEPVFGAAAEGPEAVIIAGSDYQGGGHGHSYVKGKFRDLVKSVDKAGVEYDYCIMCGDYSDGVSTSGYRGSATRSIKEIRRILKAHSGNITNKKIFFIQGNHDSKNDRFLSNGVHYRKDFIIYAMNTKSANPYHQGSERKKSVVKKTARNMESVITWARDGFS